MSKKKFDLTADLIQVTNAQERTSPEMKKTSATDIKNSNDTKVEVSKDNKASIENKLSQSKRSGVYLNISEDMHMEYKTWCIKNRTNMTEAFIEAFKLLKYNKRDI